MTYSSNITNIDINKKVDLISDELLTIINTVILASLAGGLNLFGIISNILNIIVFLKGSLNDTVNIGLFALAISDLCSLITLQWINILNNPLFINKLPMILVDVQHLSAAWPHACFARITSWVTVYITLERCLCVVIPLKVKSIITPRVTVCALVSIYFLMFLTVAPEYGMCYLDWKFVPEKNHSMLGLLFFAGKEETAKLTFNLSIGTQISSFLAIILFTAILIFKMQQKSKWRQSISSCGGDPSNDANSRSKKTVKMITLVAAIYCVCFLPMLCAFTAISIEPEFIIHGAYNNSFFLAWSFSFLFFTINSSANIFVYYSMSTKYRKMFDSIFRHAGKVNK